MIDFLWKILTWQPPDLIETLPQPFTGLEKSLLIWLGDELTQVVELLGNLLLSFPLQLVRGGEFIRIYNIVTIGCIILLPSLLAWKALYVAGGTSRILNQWDLLYFLVRFGLIAILLFRIPFLLGTIFQTANNITAILLHSAKITLYVGEEDLGLTLIVFLVILLATVFRLIIYYGVRNMTILWLILQAPIILVKWVMNGAKESVTKWIDELVGMVVIQVIHALLLVILTMVVSSGPASVEGDKMGKLWYIMMQVGVMELMLRSQFLLSHLIDFTPINEIRAMGNVVGYITGRKIRKMIRRTREDLMGRP